MGPFEFSAFIADTSGAEKRPGINSAGRAGIRASCRSEVALGGSGALDASVNSGMGRSIEAALKGGSPSWLMQLKMVLEDIIADVYAVIRELRRLPPDAGVRQT